MLIVDHIQQLESYDGLATTKEDLEKPTAVVRQIMVMAQCLLSIQNQSLMNDSMLFLKNQMK